MAWKLGNETSEWRVTSIIRSDGEVVQVGVRGPIDGDGYAWHWSIDPESRKAISEQRPVRRFVGAPST